MSAGRELDALVAEKVMGAAEVSIGYHRSGHEWERTPHYSTDIAAAWHVVEKMREYFWTEVDGIGRPEQVWRATFTAVDALPDGSRFRPASQVASTAPLAICLAAMAAIDATVTA